ncbi:S-adenosyl-L-methionine-dependent methyltransferase [Thamnocephalis sphaerospora]|uniref:S-adenosyl-L-methionine-dependent methyltransferase n=1 Tax=Thamnocephalis sphaerospora TaxID=78915 RepID=A0A4P9XMW6_9FUNG|nr:S-adenosyl-L-methionine-dependent methyltransferase [Thamnocephalis sphaerospora]|eukprot:RKP06640.1 S-adenosyl-L-methionine-dependent methyltransferase [Thamnocephalis sphaerospora]
MIQQVTRKRYHAPLSSPGRAIDIATGTGIWMMEMAADFPECEFLGIDIAQLQPTTILPKNCTFKCANILEGLSYPDGYFDYVRHSLLVTAFSKENWSSYIKECARVCASEGWIEMIEITGLHQGGGPAVKKFFELLTGALRKRGSSPETTEVLDELMLETGLADVQAKEFKLPFGSRGGSAGMLFLKDVRMLHAALTPLYMSMHCMTREEVEQIMLQLEEEVENCDAYGILRIYIGRKP